MEEIALFIKACAAAVCGFIAYWLGGIDHILIALLALVVLDYITGLLAAWQNKELSSSTGFRGIIKKIMTLAVVALAYTVEGLAGVPLREITIMFFAINEALSILENAAKTGLPIPKKLHEVLKQLKGKEE
jgi:toxin secretion/phage lysis holin